MPVPFILPALSRNNFVCQACALMVALFWGLSLTSSFHLCFRHGLTTTTTYLTVARMVRLQPEKSCFCDVSFFCVPFCSFSLFPSRRWWRDSGCCVCPLVCPPLLFVCVLVPQGPRQTRRVVVRVMWVGLSCSIASLVLSLCFGCCPTTARRCPLSLLQPTSTGRMVVVGVTG